MCGFQSKLSALSLATTNGKLYFITVTGYNTASGPFLLSYNWTCTSNCPPSPSPTPTATMSGTLTAAPTVFSPTPSVSAGYCFAPVPLAGTSGNVSVLPVVTSSVQTQYCGLGFGLSPWSYYQITLPAGPGVLYVDTCTGGQTYDSVLAVITGTSNPCLPNGATCVAGDDDAPNGLCGTTNFKRSWLYVNQGPGWPQTTYIVIVGGFFTTTTTSAFRLNYTYVSGVCNGPCPSATPTPTSTRLSATPTVSPVSPTSADATLSLLSLSLLKVIHLQALLHRCHQQRCQGSHCGCGQPHLRGCYQRLATRHGSGTLT